MQTKVYPTRAQNDEQMQISAQITLQCILMGKTSWNLSRRFPWIERASQPENTLYMDPVVWKSYPLNLLLAMYMFIIFERNYHRKLLPKIGCNYLLPFWNCDIFFMKIHELVNFDMLFPNMQRKIIPSWLSFRDIYDRISTNFRQILKIWIFIAVKKISQLQNGKRESTK
jgi:hypothetical protein